MLVASELQRSASAVNQSPLLTRAVAREMAAQLQRERHAWVDESTLATEFTMQHAHRVAGLRIPPVVPWQIRLAVLAIAAVAFTTFLSVGAQQFREAFVVIQPRSPRVSVLSESHAVSPSVYLNERLSLPSSGDARLG